MFTHSFSRHTVCISGHSFLIAVCLYFTFCILLFCCGVGFFLKDLSALGFPFVFMNKMIALINIDSWSGFSL